jgi:hypothetical protein
MSILCIWSFRHKIGISADVVLHVLGVFILLMKTFLWTITCSNKLQLVLLYEDGSFSCTSEQVPREDGGEEWAVNTGRQCRRTRISSVLRTFRCFFCLVLSPGIIRVSYTIYRRTAVSTGSMFQDLPRVSNTADNTERYIRHVTWYSCNIHKYGKL